jgi:hypothetical protein
MTCVFHTDAVIIKAHNRAGRSASHNRVNKYIDGAKYYKLKPRKWKGQFSSTPILNPS